MIQVYKSGLACKGSCISFQLESDKIPRNYFLSTNKNLSYKKLRKFLVAETKKFWGTLSGSNLNEIKLPLLKIFVNVLVLGYLLAL